MRHDVINTWPFFWHRLRTGAAGLVFVLGLTLHAWTQTHPPETKMVSTNSSETPVLATPAEIPSPPQAPTAPAPTEADLTTQFLKDRWNRYHSALNLARSWLDRLVVDPFALRERGIKGKKKLAELLDAYRRLLTIAEPDQRPALMARIRYIADITANPRFHDLPTLDETTFKEDATSYLRIAFLLDQMGLLPPIYREEIVKAHPRLNEHMRSRGVNQQMAFHLYYRHFGLKEPFPLATAFQSGVIAARRPAAWFQRRLPVYDLTHEIFVPYEFGEKPDADFFSAEDKAYLRPILAEVSRFYISLQDPDVVGELVSCMNYLAFKDMKEYRDAIDFLLNSQRENGAWGQYDWLRSRYGDYVDQAFYLHTTMVVLDALIMAFAPLTPTQAAVASRAENAPATATNAAQTAIPAITPTPPCDPRLCRRHPQPGGLFLLLARVTKHPYQSDQQPHGDKQQKPIAIPVDHNTGTFFLAGAWPALGNVTSNTPLLYVASVLSASTGPGKRIER